MELNIINGKEYMTKTLRLDNGDDDSEPEDVNQLLKNTMANMSPELTPQSSFESHRGNFLVDLAASSSSESESDSESTEDDDDSGTNSPDISSDDDADSDDSDFVILEETPVKPKFRSKNRYFEEPKSTQTLCHKCGRYGHMRWECDKYSLCIICLNDRHTCYDCPVLVCHKCGGRGHSMLDCDSKDKLVPDVSRVKICSICLESDHLSEECHLLRDDEFVEEFRQIRCVRCEEKGHGPSCNMDSLKNASDLSCFNCGHPHSGFECPYPSASNISMRAFSKDKPLMQCNNCNLKGHFIKQCLEENKFKTKGRRGGKTFHGRDDNNRQNTHTHHRNKSRKAKRGRNETDDEQMARLLSEPSNKRGKRIKGYGNGPNPPPTSETPRTIRGKNKNNKNNNNNGKKRTHNGQKQNSKSRNSRNGDGNKFKSNKRNKRQ